MIEQPTAQVPSKFDVAAVVTSTLSLCGSAFAAILVIPSLKGGFYFGTAMIVYLVVAAQVTVMLAAVVVPGLVLLLRRRLSISTTGTAMVCCALTAIVFEMIALATVPVTGSC